MAEVPPSPARSAPHTPHGDSQHGTGACAGFKQASMHKRQRITRRSPVSHTHTRLAAVCRVTGVQRRSCVGSRLPQPLAGLTLRPTPTIRSAPPAVPPLHHCLRWACPRACLAPRDCCRPLTRICCCVHLRPCAAADAPHASEAGPSAPDRALALHGRRRGYRRRLWVRGARHRRTACTSTARVRRHFHCAQRRQQQQPNARRRVCIVRRRSRHAPVGCARRLGGQHDAQPPGGEQQPLLTVSVADGRPSRCAYHPTSRVVV